MLEKIEGYYLRRGDKYLTPLKKWSKNISKAIDFETEKDIKSFMNQNKRIKGSAIKLISQSTITRIGERTVVEFNQIEKLCQQ